MRRPPELVDRHTDIFYLHPGALTQDRVPSIGSDNQVGIYVQITLFGLRFHSYYAPGFFDRADSFSIHQQLEVRIALRLRGDEVQEVPLRHQRGVFTSGREARKVKSHYLRIIDRDLQLLHPLMRETQEFLENSQFMQQL